MKSNWKILLSVACLGILTLTTSCVDNGYDLENIDKTIQLGTNELVVPINIDNITLDKVIDLDNTGQVKKVMDPISGDSVFAVIEKGTFKSKDIDIPTFSSSKPKIDYIDSDIYLKKINDELDQLVTDTLRAIAREYGLSYYDERIQAYRPEVQQAIWNNCSDEGVLARYPIGVHLTTYDTPAMKVHKAIRSIDYVSVTCDLDIEVLFENLDFLDNVKVTNIKLQLPKGIDAVTSIGEYDSSTGILDLSNNGDGVIVTGGKYKFSVSLTGIDFNAPGSGAKFTVNDGADGQFVYSTIVKILSGELEIRKDNFINGKTFFDLPKKARFMCDPEMTEITINSFTGNIKYSVDGINVKSILLSDIPDVISGDETNIFLNNPQLYLTVNDPLSDQGIYAEADFTLTSMKGEEERQTISLDNGALRIDKATNNYCLSPSKPSKYYEGYEDAEWDAFTELSNIVSGNGLPDKILVKVDNPGIPEQHVVDFKLGQSIEPIQGEYFFYAPLSLDEYSVIVYESKDTGWNDNGDLDKLTINKLKVKANISSDIPLGATLTMQALGDDGEAIPGVEFNTVKLEPNKSGQAITFEQISGTITNLDGISIRASIVSDGSSTLKPSQKLELENVRITVTANYKDKL